MCYRNNKLLVFTLSILISSCSSNKPSYECDFYPETLMPTWIADPSGLIGDEYIGIGMSGKVEGGPSEQMSKAVQLAQANAAGAISSKIFSISNSNERAIIDNSDSTIHSSFEYDATLSSKMILSNIKITDKWLDTNSCYFWVRSSISKSEITKIQAKQYTASDHFNQYLRHISEAKDSSLGYEKRMTQYNLAKESFHNVDFMALRSFNDRVKESSFYWNELLELRSKIDFDRNNVQVAALLEKSESYYVEAQRKLSEGKNKEAKLALSNAIKIASTVDYQKFEFSEAKYLNKYKQDLSSILIKEKKNSSSRELAKAEKIYTSSVKRATFLSANSYASSIKNAIKILSNVNFDLLGLSKQSYLSKYEKQLEHLQQLKFHVGDSVNKVMKILGDPADWVSNSVITRCTKGYKKGSLFRHSACERWTNAPDLNYKVALKYGRHWFQFEQGILVCIIHSEGFRITQKSRDWSSYNRDYWTTCIDYRGREKSQKYVALE